MRQNIPPDGRCPSLNADALYREQVEAARRQTLEEKFMAGIELFKLSCEFMRAGIRIQHPDASEDEIFEMVEERLALARRLENGE